MIWQLCHIICLMVCIEDKFPQAHSLKDVGSQYNALYTIYTGSPRSPIIFKYIYVLKNLITYIVLCKGENKTMPILDINNQNTTYIFATEDTHVVFFLNLNLQLHRRVLLIQIMNSKNKLTLDKVNFDMID